MRALALASLLALSGCFTTIGAGAGAGIGYIAGNPVRGAVCGGLIGLRVDIAILQDIAKAGRALTSWIR